MTSNFSSSAQRAAATTGLAMNSQPFNVQPKQQEWQQNHRSHPVGSPNTTSVTLESVPQDGAAAAVSSHRDSNSIATSSGAHPTAEVTIVLQPSVIGSIHTTTTATAELPHQATTPSPHVALGLTPPSPSSPPHERPHATNSQQEHQHQVPPSSQWLAAAALQTSHGVRQRMSQASDQLGHSLRQLYASASSITDVPPSYHNIPGIVPYYHGRSLGPPPSYDDVINPYAPPPTYQSLFGQMREARKTSRSLLDLLRRLLIIVLSTLGCTVLIAFMIIIPFTMIIVGAIYIDECRIEHIPAFLLVGGLVWAAKNVLHCYAQCKHYQEEEARAAETASEEATTIDDEEQQQQAVAVAGVEDEILRQTGGSRRYLSSAEQATASVTAMTTGADGQQAAARRTREVQNYYDNSTAPQIYDNSSTANNNSSFTSPTVQQQVDVSAAVTVSLAADDLQSRRDRHNRRLLKSSICESLLNCILLGWFIAGCVIVFRNYEPDFDNSTSARYCHRTVYMYTFWLISSAILFFGFFVGCICCLVVSSAVASHQNGSDDIA